MGFFNDAFTSINSIFSGINSDYSSKTTGPSKEEQEFAAYKKKVGELDINPKTASLCEQKKTAQQTKKRR